MYIGGGEISLIYFLSALDKKCYQATVICTPGLLFKRLAELKINAVPLNLIPLKPFVIPALRQSPLAINPSAFVFNIIAMVMNTYRLYRVIMTINPDLIHLNTMKDAMHIIGINILRKIPTVWHMRVTPDKDRITEKNYVKFVSSFVNKIIATSNAVAEGVRQLDINAKKIEIVYNPIDTDRFRPRNRVACRRKYHLPTKAIIIGSLGRLHQEKGYELLLEAVELIKRKIGNLHVLIAGSPWKEGYNETLRNQAHRLGLSQNTTILEWQSDAATLISALDVLVLLPLRNEAFGRILAEGMACGIPVIGAAVGGIKEVVHNNETGLLVPPRDAGAVAQALSTLLENRALSKNLAASGRKYVIAKFGIERHLKKMTDIFNELVRETALQRHDSCTFAGNDNRNNKKLSKLRTGSKVHVT